METKVLSLFPPDLEDKEPVTVASRPVQKCLGTL